MSNPLIVTARLDTPTQTHFDALRERYFPPGRTVIAAHLTMFHAIAPSEHANLLAAVRAFCAQHGPFPVAFSKLRNLGRGVAVVAQSELLMILRRSLVRALAGPLTPQDAQGYRPHVTLANKLSSDEASALFQHLQSGWQAHVGRIEGVAVWEYLGPHWRLDEAIPLVG